MFGPIVVCIGLAVALILNFVFKVRLPNRFRSTFSPAFSLIVHSIPRHWIMPVITRFLVYLFIPTHQLFSTAAQEVRGIT